MMGIPAFAGFASKLSLTMASFDSPLIIWSLAALVTSTVLNALYYVPAVIVVLTHNKDKNPQKNFAAPAPTTLYKFSMFIFLALNFYLGLFCVPLLRLITRGVNVLL